MTITTKKREQNAISAVLMAVVFVCALLCVLLGTAIRSSSNDAHAISVDSPIITEQPQNVEKTYGEDAVLTCKAQPNAGITLMYSWYTMVDGNRVFVGSGTDATMALTRPSQSGQYVCVVRATSMDGSYAETESLTVTATIYKKVATVQIDPVETVYGQPEVPLTFDVISDLVDGDNASDLGVSLTRKKGQEAGEYEITGSFKSDGYAVNIQPSVYTILPRPVTIETGNVTTYYGSPIQEIPYGIVKGTFAQGETLADLKISVVKESGLNAKRYEVYASWDNSNYDVSFLPSASYTILPLTLDVRYENIDSLVYNGKLQTIRTELLGFVREGDEVSVTVTSDKAIKYAGTYEAYVYLSNPNYRVVNDGKRTFTVKKADLVITLKNDHVASADSYRPVFLYEGFVNGEDEKVLSSLPQAPSVPSAGSHTLMPFGAEGANYAITYKEGNVAINIDTLHATGVQLKGSFSPDASVKVTVDGCDKEKGTVKNFLRSISYASRLEITGDRVGHYSAEIDGVGKLNPLFRRICIVDENGEIHAMKASSVKDGKLIFTSEIAGVVVVYNDYILIVIFVVALLLLLIPIAIYLSKDKKRHDRNSDMHFYARKFADDVVPQRKNAEDEEEEI